MNYKHLGRTGLKVSPLCLGTMNFGPHTTEPDSFAIMDRALDEGINFFDTADVYGGLGATEEILGNWFAQGGRRRERVVLATKVYGGMIPDDAADPNLDSGLSARKIIQCCDDSLRRMKTSWIDLYQMHHVDRDCPWEETWEAMETLVRQGKVRYVGSSNFAGWDIATANQEAAKRNFLGLVCEQSVYSLCRRMVELEVVPACRRYGVGLIPWSPLNGGLLGGILEDRGEGRRASEWMDDQIENHRTELEAYESLCKDIGEPPANVALAWLLNNPVVTAPIIGPRTMDQLTGALKVPELELSGDTRKKLDKIWPGPGGEAPQAYAW